jgi:tetratricopeptide (TPR) repeat protein
MGQAFRAQDDWSSALDALERYTDLRPGNPAAHLQMAELCEEIEIQTAGMYLSNLLTLLPTAEVKTPDVPLDTPYRRADGPARDSYVAETAFRMSPYDEDRRTLFMHTPSWVSYTLSLPQQTTLLRFDLGLDPRTSDWPGDGATFEVLVDGERLFFEHLDKGLAHQGWQARTVDLAPWAGQEVVLTLGTTPGPIGDPTGDWAGWGEPQVVDRQLPALETLDCGRRAVEALQQAGYTAMGLVAVGKQARARSDLEEAQVWYERAARLEPDLGDPWYRLGILFEQQEQWTSAIAAYEQALGFNRYQEVSGSDLHCRLGTIYGWNLEPRRPGQALGSLRTALELDDFITPVDAARCSYLYGFVQRERGTEPAQYIDDFQRAVDLNPKQAWAHLMLGVAIYERDRDAARAETEIRKSLDLAPGNKWAYYHLGEIHRQEGRMADAAAMYEQALRLDPEFEAAQVGLRRIQASDGN